MAVPRDPVSKEGVGRRASVSTGVGIYAREGNRRGEAWKEVVGLGGRLGNENKYI